MEPLSPRVETTQRSALFVSIVIPTYNRRDLMTRCLLALAAQTYADFEVIVIDDASTDDSVQIMRGIGVEFPKLNLVVLENETNLGANPSRNRGIRRSKGSVIAFLDSDCIAQPDWLARLMDGFSDPGVAAVTGLVTDPEPSNIWELTFKGTHRIGPAGPARRLIAGNMAIRKSLLEAHELDEDYAYRSVVEAPDLKTSGRSDEEGIFLKLRAAGKQVVACPTAEVYHEHFYDRRSFFKQAYRGGSSAARLVYKFHLRHRTDMIPFMAAYASLPLILVRTEFAVVPLFCFLVALGAITYNDLFLKRKTIGETLISFPTLLAYYHVRLFGYVRQTLALRLGENDIERERLER